MPKEYVLGILEFIPADHPDPGPNYEPWRVEVGWDKLGTGVRIATTNPQGEIGTVESGLWVGLDRNRINDLIRLLRKARDQAFGRDE